MPRTPRRLAAAAGLFFTYATAHASDVVSLQPTHDAYLSVTEPDLNWNTPYLEQFGYYSSIKRPLLRFDLSQLPDGATITSARLNLTLQGIYGGQGHLSALHRLPNDAWAEDTVTWNSFDQSGPVTIATLPGADELGERTWTIDLDEWNWAADLEDGAVTLLVRWHDWEGGAESDGYYKANTYSSKEGSAPPTLVIEYDAPCPGDFNHDGVRDTRDVVAFLNAWSAHNQSADCDQNNTINTRDVTCFLNLWVPGC